MSNPETAKIIERLIACRGTLKVVERQYSVNLQPERAVMADAANALTAYDRTMTQIAEGGCVNHPDRPVRSNLDGDNLCQECCDAWARGEGDAAAQRDFDDE